MFGSPAQPSENAFGYSLKPSVIPSSAYESPHKVAAFQHVEIPARNIKLLQQCVEKSTGYCPSFVDARLKLFQTGGDVLRAWEALLNRELKATEKDYLTALDQPLSVVRGKDETHTRVLAPRFPSSERAAGTSTPMSSGQESATDLPSGVRTSPAPLVAESASRPALPTGQNVILSLASQTSQQPPKPKHSSFTQRHDNDPVSASRLTQGHAQKPCKAWQEPENNLIIHVNDIFPDQHPFSALPTAAEIIFQNPCTIHLLIEAPDHIDDGPLKYLYQDAADGIVKGYRRHDSTCFVFDVVPFKVPVQRLRVATRINDNSDDWHRAIADKLNFYIGITFKGPGDYESVIPHIRPGMTRQETRRPATLGAYVRVNMTKPTKTTRVPVWYHFGEDMPTQHAMWFEPRWSADFSATAPRPREVNSCPPQLESNGVASRDAKLAMELSQRTASLLAKSKMQDTAKKFGVAIDINQPEMAHIPKVSSMAATKVTMTQPDGPRQTSITQYTAGPRMHSLPNTWRKCIRAGYEPTTDITKSHSQAGTFASHGKKVNKTKDKSPLPLEWPRGQRRPSADKPGKYKSLAGIFEVTTSHLFASQQQSRERRANPSQPQSAQRHGAKMETDPVSSHSSTFVSKPMGVKVKTVINLDEPETTLDATRSTQTSWLETLQERTRVTYSRQNKANQPFQKQVVPESQPAASTHHSSDANISRPASALKSESESIRNLSKTQGSDGAKEPLKVGMPHSSDKPQQVHEAGSQNGQTSEQLQKVELFAVKTATAQPDNTALNVIQRSPGHSIASTTNSTSSIGRPTNGPINGNIVLVPTNQSTVVPPQQTHEGDRHTSSLNGDSSGLNKPAATKVGQGLQSVDTLGATSLAHTLPLQPLQQAASGLQPARPGMTSSKSKRSGPTAHNSRFIRNLKRPLSPDLEHKDHKRPALFPLLNANSPGKDKKVIEVVDLLAHVEKTQVKKPSTTSVAHSTPAPPDLPEPLVRLKRKYPVPKAPPGVVFYRTASKRVLFPGELLSESDDDVDETALLDEHHAFTDTELAHLPHSQRSLIKRLNAHFWAENVTHDGALHGALRRFVGAHGAWMLRKREPRRRLFLAACERFRVWGALSQSHKAELETLLDSVAGFEGETDGSSDEEPAARRKRKKAMEPERGGDALSEPDEAWPMVDW